MYKGTIKNQRSNRKLYISDEDQLLVGDPPPTWRGAQRWAVAAAASVAVCVVVILVMMLCDLCPPHLAFRDAGREKPRVGLLLTGTPLDEDLQGASVMAARESGIEVQVMETESKGTPSGVLSAFTELWEAGVRVFLVGGDEHQIETLCHHLQEVRREALLLSPTTTTSIPCSHLLSLSPPPAAHITTQISAMAGNGLTHIIPVLTEGGRKHLPHLQAIGMAQGLIITPPVYLNTHNFSITQMNEALTTFQGAGIWVSVEEHLPQIVASAREVFLGHTVMLHTHPAHIATLLTHPAARTAAEDCAVSTVQWVGATQIDDPARRHLLAALTPKDPFVSALTYDAARLALQAAVHGDIQDVAQLKTIILNKEAVTGITFSTDLKSRPTSGWAARLRLVARQMMGKVVLQDSPWLLEGMTHIEEGNKSWKVKETHAPARLVTQEEVWDLVSHTTCNSQVRIEVQTHDPLTHHPVVTVWPAQSIPELLLIPNSSPRGFSMRASCEDQEGKVLEVGCQGATAHNDSLRCVTTVSQEEGRRRTIRSLITHGIHIQRRSAVKMYWAMRKVKGIFKHADFRALVPQIGGCLGATGGCTFCFVFLLWHNVSINPGVCMGACAVAVGGSCATLLSKGIQYKMEHTVICTELFMQGRISLDSYLADASYGARLASQDPQALYGYHLAARPLVAAMQVSTTLSDLVEAIAQPWVKHMEYQEGLIAVDDQVGRLMTALGLPLCSMMALLSDHIFIVALLALMAALTRCSFK